MTAVPEQRSDRAGLVTLPRHLRSLDVLRGVAALWVVLFHIWNRYYPGLNTQRMPVQAGLDWSLQFASSFFSMQFGYLGVTLFFVLSGFCIHLPQARRYAATGSDGLQIGAFMRRRFWRLYPAYLASIVLAVGVLATFPSLLWLAKGKPFDVVATLQLQNAAISALFLQHFWPHALQLNGVYWTLLFEVQFYLLYPVLLIVMRRVGGSALLVLLLGIELWSSFHPPGIQYLFFTRYFEWYLGVWAAEYLLRYSRPGHMPALICVTALAVSGGMLTVFTRGLFDMRDVLVSMGFAALLLVAVRRDAHAQPLLPRPGRLSHGLEYCGRVSYSLYLVHVPLIDLTWNGLGLLSKYKLLGAGPVAVLAPLSVPLSIWVAGWFFRHIEEPCMRLGNPKLQAIPAA